MFSYQNQAALAGRLLPKKDAMSEATFAKQFLTALDSRPIKLSSDHVADPKTYPPTGAYILPKMPNPKRKRASPTSPTSTDQPTITITLHNLRNASQSLTLEDQSPATTSVLDLKTAFAAHHGVNADKLKLLFAKKPCADTKTVAEILGTRLEEGMKGVEFAVMVMPGAASGPSVAAATPAPAPAPAPEDPAVASPPLEAPAPEVEMTDAGEPVEGEKVGGERTGADVLQTEDFWADLKDFLIQRLRDEGEAVRLAGVFKGAWESSSGRP
ncbi:hypothetical protein H2201_008170 [Coniosporium apollinis]|uniref:Ubiquitin-like domain-containing protein n=2 Tax=Coniosporium TaxID=2810619 RepID=A0ABQ9NJR7_9PEZI|nr:hypothetical protein H2199_004338 [Cladosporium sp. JES 115]KAJ9657480.1 hypothetical protein H2201_008170 [Coniosporium apollinis]